MTRTTTFRILFVQEEEDGRAQPLYTEAVTVTLPRPVPVGIASKARTKAIMTLLQKATADLMIATGVIQPPPQEGTNHATPEDPGGEPEHPDEEFSAT